MLSFFPRGVLDEILNLIESVSEDFPSNSFTMCVQMVAPGSKMAPPQGVLCLNHRNILKNLFLQNRLPQMPEI